jgi:CheY-like chemotaxis protein
VTATTKLQGARILVVDDDETARLVAGLMLKKLGCTVQAVSGGKEALGTLEESPGEFDCVLLDLSMPDMSGPEALAKIRVLQGDLRIMITSGSSASEVDRQLQGATVAGFLPKPYDLKLLQEVLEAAL